MVIAVKYPIARKDSHSHVPDDKKIVAIWLFWLMFDEGITDKSTHGNVLWHQMRLDFKLRNNGVKQI